MATWNRAGDLARLNLSDYWDAAYLSIEVARSGALPTENRSRREGEITILPVSTAEGAAD